jgi:hypothetical protein
MEDLGAFFEDRLAIGQRLILQIASAAIQYRVAGVALEGERKRRLLGEGLVAAGAFPPNDKASYELDQRVA